MMLSFILVLGFPIVAHGGARTALRTTKLSVEIEDVMKYSFTQFMQDYGRSYKAGSEDYRKRAALFQESMQRINNKNSQNHQEGRSWVAGVHAFMDWTPEERRSIQGYKPSQARQGKRTAMAGLQVGFRDRSRMQLNSTLVDSYFDTQSAEHRNQGNCGSCWAISAVEAVEAQLKKSGYNVRLSPQALVDCVPNPQHCGGTGGCDGATGELAYAFMQEHGIPLEEDLPYKAVTGTCQMGSGNYPTKKRITLSGWTTLPSNQGAPLMQALVQDGSVVVAVDGNDWFDYSAGIFDGCSKDATIGHAVLAKGYGSESDKKYWVIQNSWGMDWGENGDIRLLRHDDDTAWCGVDSDPKEGEGCDGGPPTVPVCGMCGVLYDSVVPRGAQVVDDDAPGSFARATAGDYTPWRPQ